MSHYIHCKAPHNLQHTLLSLFAGLKNALMQANDKELWQSGSTILQLVSAFRSGMINLRWPQDLQTTRDATFQSQQNEHSWPSTFKNQLAGVLVAYFCSVIARESTTISVLGAMGLSYMPCDGRIWLPHLAASRFIRWLKRLTELSWRPSPMGQITMTQSKSVTAQLWVSITGHAWRKEPSEALWRVKATMSPKISGWGKDIHWNCLWATGIQSLWQKWGSVYSMITFVKAWFT